MGKRHVTHRFMIEIMACHLLSFIFLSEGKTFTYSRDFLTLHSFLSIYSGSVAAGELPQPRVSKKVPTS